MRVTSRPLPTDEFEPLVIDVVSADDAGSVLMAVSGDVDAMTVGQLQEAFLEAVRRHRPARIEMDVAGVTFLDSAGIRALVVCQADARQVGCSIVLVRTPPSVQRVLEITGLLPHFGVHQE